MASLGQDPLSLAAKFSPPKQPNPSEASPAPSCSATTFRKPPQHTPTTSLDPPLTSDTPTQTPSSQTSQRTAGTGQASPAHPLQARTGPTPSTPRAHGHPHSPPAAPDSAAATAAPAIKGRSPAPFSHADWPKWHRSAPWRAGANRRARRVPPVPWPRPAEEPGPRREPGGLGAERREGKMENGWEKDAGWGGVSVRFGGLARGWW